MAKIEVSQSAQINIPMSAIEAFLHANGMMPAEGGWKLQTLGIDTLSFSKPELEVTCYLTKKTTVDSVK